MIKVSLTLLFSLMITMQTLAKETIIWHRFDIAPVFIVAGPYTGQGYTDRLMNLIISELKEYNHQIIVANVKRTITDIKKLKNVVSCALVKTPKRSQFIEFSITAAVHLANEIFIPKSNQARIKKHINKDGTLDLERAIKDNSLKLGISNERAYGNIIDDILKDNTSQSHIIVRNASDLSKGLIAMMNRRRIDYTIEFPIVANYHARTQKIEQKFKSIPISNVTPFVASYCGFPKNDWGRKLKSKVNKILRKYRQTEPVLKFYSNWLPTNRQEQYSNIVKYAFDD